ncbi:uroporphyrinogen-III C-methyltransferase [Macrococcoides bohemicum]|uniref:uroporphyrinogen-III C-methyltransferase n=1 Tax=Macrococcoides bohemicum TaxID=1903056 RepID=UPI00193F3274|nr:uroporphyrinogen-III C-methyltransferase [Macrococcus bohemicus]QRN50251.1 uroporphyrinogen-III C-methyltransferase [Macrococcus bohemicus]
MDRLGKVIFIGAGPGDPGLVSYKAIRRIKTADVIIYDRLVNPILLQLSKPDCELIYVGKNPDVKYKAQNEINRIINEKAALGSTVVRLKGGDPGIFGRLSEEVDSLEKKYKYEVIPGITSASAAALYSGFPLTDRAHAPHVTFSTGHLQKDSMREIDFQALAKGGTLALYMGMKALPEIVSVLSKDMDAHLKVAVIGNASYGYQKTVIGDLSTINDLVIEHKVTHPAMIIIGDVVNVRDDLSWFEQLPEFGLRKLFVSQNDIDKEEILDMYDQGGFYYAIDQLSDDRIQSKYFNIHSEILSFHSFDEFITDSLESISLLENRYNIKINPSKVKLSESLND